MKMLCDCPFTHFEVNNPNGDVTFCSVHNMVLGNVNKNIIEEIWNGKAYKRVRQKFLDGKILKYIYLDGGAIGLAVKAILMQIVGVNALLYLTARIQRFSFKKYLFGQFLQ